MAITHDSMEWQQSFGRRLRFLRTLAKLTQGELAGRLQITVEHLSNMERGASAPSFGMVVRLAEALGTEPANLFLFIPGEARNGSKGPGDASRDVEWTRYVSAVGRVEYDAHAGKFFWSDSLYRMLGLEPGEAEAGPVTFLRHVHPEDLERAAQSVAEVFAGQDQPVQSCRVLRKDGEERFVFTHRSLERDEAGRILRMVGVVVDVTEQRRLLDSLRTMHASLEERVRERTQGLAETVRRLEEEVGRRARAEAQARENEWRLRSLGDNLIGGAVFQVVQEADGTRRLAYASAGLAGLLGIGPRQGAPGLERMLAAIHPEDRAEFLADMERCSATGEPLRREVRFLRPDGSQVWVRIQAAHRPGMSQEMVCDGLALDVTDLKRAEADRGVAVQRLQRAHALARLGHWEYRSGEDADWWSDEIYEALGLEPQSRPATMELFLAHIHPDDREAVTRELRAAVAEQREYRASYRLIRQDGSPAFGYSLGRPVPGSRPGKAVYHGTYLDVTEHREACAAAQAESERLRALLAVSGMGTWAWEGDAVRLDPAACRILGLDPDPGRVSAAEVGSWLAPEDQGRLPRRDERGPVRIEFRTVARVRPPGGGERRVLLAGCLHRNPKGRATRAEGVFLDLDGLPPA
ncbi:MAG: PAS domain-containing protein [Thermodesulfobacteriota bacterium]